MNRPILLTVLGLWTILGTVLLSRWWYANPEYFPSLPPALWQRIDLFFGATNLDQSRDVELLVVTASAFLIVLATTLVAAAIGKRLIKRS
jgi:hypothetical protein